MSTGQPTIVKEDCLYTSCYCEENIWQICHKLVQNNEKSDCYVLFISSDDERIPVWFQGKGDRLVVWDYHVVFAVRGEEKALVYDLDTKLPFPSQFAHYVLQSFLYSLLYKDDELENMMNGIKFRVLKMDEFYKHFSSDRSHMKKNGEWLQPPPTWECIQQEPGTTHNLTDFKDLKDTNTFRYGTVMTLPELCTFFGVDYDKLVQIMVADL